MLSVTVTGHVAREPRTGEAGGTPVTNFTILTNTKVKGEDKVSAVDVAIWGKRSETAAKYITKGSLVSATGTGFVEAYEGANGIGGKIVMNCFDFTLPPKPKSGGDDDLF